MKQITRIFTVALTGATLFIAAPNARAATDVVASIPELAAIAKDIGGADVSVYSIAKPNQDYHTVETRPSDVARLSKADLVVSVGLGLDPWLTSLSNATGNTQIRRGGSKFVDASDDVPKIEVPQNGINGASGDIHPQGNPHYYYDPVYAIFAARNITRGLVKVDPKNANDYRAGYAKFRKTVLAKTEAWKRELAPDAGKKLVTYHRNYNYFLRRFGIQQLGTMEPRPGIPPNARHISDLLATMKQNNVKAILIEGIYPLRYPNLVAKQVGGKVTVGPYSVSSLNAGAYVNMIDKLVDTTRSAF